MKWLIVEDQVGPIVNWLMELRTLGIVGAAPLLNVRWMDVLRYSQQMYSSVPPSERLDLPERCESVLWNSHVVGVASADVVVLCVMTEAASADVIEWLAEGLPPSCLSFLDYVLAGDASLRLAESIAPMLAKSYSQVCVNHSSRIFDIDVDPTLGLAGAQSPFYREKGWRLITEEGTRRCVREAQAFWKSFNETFTGDRGVDKVISLFVRGKTDGWDSSIGGPFHHDSLQAHASVTCGQVKAFGMSPGDDNDSLKGLFQCRVGMAREEAGKKVPWSEIKAALEIIEFGAWKLDGSAKQESVRWAPPFLPGILLLCHLKLMLNAFSDRKEGRTPPLVRIGPKVASFAFDRNVENAFGNWRNDRGNSCLMMQAAERGHIGESDASWLSSTAAGSIRELLQPVGGVPLRVTVAADTVSITWDDASGGQVK